MSGSCPSKEHWDYDPQRRPAPPEGCGSPGHFPPAGTVLGEGGTWSCPDCGTTMGPIATGDLDTPTETRTGD